MYTQFNLVLRDVSAFLVDGDYSWSLSMPNRTHALSKGGFISFLPVIDKCGVFLKLQQVKEFKLCFEIKLKYSCNSMNC